MRNNQVRKPGSGGKPASGKRKPASTISLAETPAERLARFRQAQAKLKASGFVGHLGRVATNIAQ